MKDGTSWSVARDRLRRFQLRSGWTVAEIGSALRVGYRSMMPNDWIERLLDTASRNPRSRTGLASVVEICADLRADAPPFEEWLEVLRKRRHRMAVWDSEDAWALKRRAAQEAQRERRRAYLMQEARHSHRGVAPTHNPLAGLDAGTISRLSGGTMRSAYA